MNISTLSEEQLKRLSESQLLEKSQHMVKWILPPAEVQQRKEMIDQTIKIWKLSSKLFMNDFENSCKSNLSILDLAIWLKPVKDEWLNDFIEGWVYSSSQYPKYQEKSIPLKKPVFLVLFIFISTRYYQEYFFERSVPESDTLETIINENIKESVNTRDALRTLAENKKMILNDPRQIKKLKLEYLLEQDELIKEFKNKQPKDKNHHPRIFTNGKALNLFEYWHGEASEKSYLSEYSFIYRSMIKDKLIHENVRPTEFIDFLDKNYKVTLTEIKTYDLCKGGNKPSRYSTAKRLFKL